MRRGNNSGRGNNNDRVQVTQEQAQQAKVPEEARQTELRRQQEELRHQQEELRRQQEELRRQQEEFRRQQEEFRRQPQAMPLLLPPPGEVLQGEVLQIGMRRASNTSPLALVIQNPRGAVAAIGSAVATVDTQVQTGDAQEIREVVDAQDLLHQAIMRDSADDIREAVRLGANVNNGKGGQASLVWAVILNRFKAVECLLECGANANIVYSGSSLVLHALKLRGEYNWLCGIPSATLLVRNGANFSGDVSGETAMGFAINAIRLELRNEALGFIQELINHGWNIHNDTEGYVGGCSRNARITNIWYEALRSSCNNSELLKLFIRNGANPNQIIYQSGFRGASWTPLLLAIEKFDKEAIKLLLDSGADINQKASPFYRKIEQHSPISYALMLGDASIIELLLERGATL